MFRELCPFASYNAVSHTSFILQTSEKFRTELANRGVAHSKFAGQTYDAVWAMALALARTEVLLNRQNESMANYKHTRRDFTYRLLEQLKLLHFVGVSVRRSFGRTARRINKSARPFPSLPRERPFFITYVREIPRGGNRN